ASYGPQLLNEQCRPLIRCCCSFPVGQLQAVFSKWKSAWQSIELVAMRTLGSYLFSFREAILQAYRQHYSYTIALISTMHRNGQNSLYAWPQSLLGIRTAAPPRMTRRSAIVSETREMPQAHFHIM